MGRKKNSVSKFRKDIFQDQFKNLCQVLKDSKLSFECVNRMFSDFDDLNSKSNFINYKFWLIIFCFGVFLLHSIGVKELAELVGFQSFFQKSCLLLADGKIKDMFLPPFDCSVCSNLDSIPKVLKISKEEFETKYAYSNVPIVIESAINDWKALQDFNFSFFKQLYSQNLNLHQCQFFPYQTNFENLREALDQIEADYLNSTKPWYIGWSNCDPLTTAILREYYTQPYFLPENSETSRLNWIFMGTPGYGAPMHIDKVGNPSWQAQIKGTKLWILEAPPECYFKCKTLKVQVNAGDIIVLDTDKWFHQTIITGNEISITIGSEYD